MGEQSMTKPMNETRLDEELERLLDAVHCRRPGSMPALRARLRQLLDDAERLDWLDAKGTFSVALNRHDGRQFWLDANERPVFLRLWLKDRGGENQSLRDALDEVRL
jgi:hypothetical protein